MTPLSYHSSNLIALETMRLLGLISHNRVKLEHAVTFMIYLAIVVSLMFASENFNME